MSCVYFKVLFKVEMFENNKSFVGDRLELSRSSLILLKSKDKLLEVETSKVQVLSNGAENEAAKIRIDGVANILLSFAPYLEQFFFVLRSYQSGKRLKTKEQETSFYGPTDPNYKALSLRLCESSDIGGEVFGPFQKLSHAVDFMILKPSLNLQLWSVEEGDHGKRSYYCSSYEEFYKYYKALEPDRRSHYEVIQEFLPCKLFLDLEFVYEYNTGRNGQEMTKILISYLCDFICLNFPEKRRENLDFIDLQSLYEHKFSRHIIFDNVIFENTANLAAFMSEFVEYCRLRLTSEEDREKASNLFVMNDKGKEMFIADMGVYNKNRNFRLIYSSKKGKNSFLLPLCSDGSETVKKAPFEKSLICNVKENHEISKYLPKKGEEKETNNAMSSVSRNFVNVNIKESYPFLSDFVMEIISKDNGYIRCIKQFNGSSKICYSIGGAFRYCANIGCYFHCNMFFPFPF